MAMLFLIPGKGNLHQKVQYIVLHKLEAPHCAAKALKTFCCSMIGAPILIPFPIAWGSLKVLFLTIHAMLILASSSQNVRKKSNLSHYVCLI